MYNVYDIFTGRLIQSSYEPSAQELAQDILERMGILGEVLLEIENPGQEGMKYVAQIANGERLDTL